MESNTNSLLLKLSTVDMFSANSNEQKAFALGGARPIQTEVQEDCILSHGSNCL